MTTDNILDIPMGDWLRDLRPDQGYLRMILADEEEYERYIESHQIESSLQKHLEQGAHSSGISFAFENSYQLKKIEAPPRAGLIPKRVLVQGPQSKYYAIRWVRSRYGEQEVSNYVSSFEAPLRMVKQQLEDLFPPHLVSGRLKNEASLHEKVERKDRHYSTFTDVAGARVIFDNLSQLQSGIETVRENFNVHEEVDFLKPSDQSYYVGYHFVIEVDGKPIELQLKTAKMYALSKWAHDILYKQPRELRSNPSLLQSAMQYAFQYSDYAREVAPEPPEPPPVVKRSLGQIEFR